LIREFRFRFLSRENLIDPHIEKLVLAWAPFNRLLGAVDEKSSKHLDRVSTKKRILFITGYGLGSHYKTFEPSIMMALKKDNHEILSLICGGALPACEFNIVGNNEPPVDPLFRMGLTNAANSERCNFCTNNVKTLYSSLPIELHQYSQYLTLADYSTALDISSKLDLKDFRTWEYEGIKLGEEVYASVLRATFRGTIPESPIYSKLVRRYIYSSLVMYIAIKKAYKELKPDRIVLIHGVYLTHGISARVGVSMGIPVVVMGGGGIRKNTVIMCHGETYHKQLISESNKVWENSIISAAERNKVLNYATEKRSNGGSVDYLNYHPNPINDIDKIFKECGIDNERPIVSVYTNVLWDAQIFYSDNIFFGMIDWLVKTIELLGKNKNIWGVIRIHPAEKKGGIPTSEPIMEIIKKRFKTLPDNVRIISPDSNISSYALANCSIASIIYGTKMGLEIALMGVPLIICGETFSRNKGYGIELRSLTQYEELIEGIQDACFDIKIAQETAIKYANYYYFKRMLDLPLGSKDENSENIEDVISDYFINFNKINNPSLDIILSGIVNLTPFYLR